MKFGKKNKKEIFPIEKILSMDTDVYVESKEKKLSDYDMKAIHSWNETVTGFASKVPEGTEAVTEHRLLMDGNTSGFSWLYLFGNREYYQSGIALIPKK